MELCWRVEKQSSDNLQNSDPILPPRVMGAAASTGLAVLRRLAQGKDQLDFPVGSLQFVGNAARIQPLVSQGIDLRMTLRDRVGSTVG